MTTLVWIGILVVWIGIQILLVTFMLVWMGGTLEQIRDELRKLNSQP